jgi:hypothetical protein
MNLAAALMMRSLATSKETVALCGLSLNLSLKVDACTTLLMKLQLLSVTLKVHDCALLLKWKLLVLRALDVAMMPI